MDQLRLPNRISQDLSIQHAGEETLLYDERRHMAFCLDRIASAVWKFSDGAHSIAEIAAAATLETAQPVNEDAVLFALAQLEADSLLQASTRPLGEPDFVTLSAISRRQMLGRLGAGAALMLPVVAGIMAPKAAQAYSGCFDCGASRPAQPEPGLPFPQSAAPLRPHSAPTDPSPVPTPYDSQSAPPKWLQYLK